WTPSLNPANSSSAAARVRGATSAAPAAADAWRNDRRESVVIGTAPCGVGVGPDIVRGPTCGSQGWAKKEPGRVAGCVGLGERPRVSGPSPMHGPCAYPAVG